MLNKLVGWITSIFGSYAGTIISVVSYIAVFAGGCYVTHLYYDHKILKIQNETVQEISKVKSETIAELEKREKETAKIISERDDEKAKHNADIAELNDTISRLRNNRPSAEQLSAASRNSGKSAEELLARGRELEERCNKLLSRSVDLAGRISTDKDAVVKLATQQSKQTTK